MLIGSKMEEIFPLKMKTIYEKIVHKKIEKKELVEMEARMVEKLGFICNYPTIYESSLIKLYSAILEENNSQGSGLSYR